MITLDNAVLTPLAEKIRKTGGCRKLTEPLATVMATYLLSEKMKPIEKRFHHTYLDTLPKSYYNFPIFFKDEDLNYLEGSSI